MLISPW